MQFSVIIVGSMFLFLLLNLVSAEITFFEGENLEYVISEDDTNNTNITIENITEEVPIELNNTVEAFCGDSVCSELESCSSCKRDCGPCNKSSEFPTSISGDIVENDDNEVVEFIEDQSIKNLGHYISAAVIVVLGLVLWRIIRK